VLSETKLREQSSSPAGDNLLGSACCESVSADTGAVEATDVATPGIPAASLSPKATFAAFLLVELTPDQNKFL